MASTIQGNAGHGTWPDAAIAAEERAKGRANTECENLIIRPYDTARCASPLIRLSSSLIRDVQERVHPGRLGSGGHRPGPRVAGEEERKRIAQRGRTLGERERRHAAAGQAPEVREAEGLGPVGSGDAQEAAGV